MVQKDTSIQELAKKNQELREKLIAAEQWIGREFSDMQLRRHKEEATNTTRIKLTETPEHIEKRITKYFQEESAVLGEENQKLLIDSEINFYHIVRNKELDGFVVTNTYQKILENLFEQYITSYFREQHKRGRLHPAKNDLLEKTLYKVLHQNFHLSLGKLYQILERIMRGEKSDIIDLFEDSLRELPAYTMIYDATFWEDLTESMNTGAFGEKRHSGKITFQDVQKLRTIMTGNFSQGGFIKNILRFFA
ncbi:MAG: hypothetical protein WC753_01205 [Candidatus Gracilibacteria bacterium]|jgi:hypothetical protein